jgi:hypothetical protein
MIPKIALFILALVFTLDQLQAAQPSSSVEGPDPVSYDKPPYSPQLIEFTICINTPSALVCWKIKCKIRWSVLIQQGDGPHWMTLPGCTIEGTATDLQGQSFAIDNSEGMVQALELASQVPKGSLKFLEVLQSPTFPDPEEKDHRIVAKTYPVLTSSSGRYLPLEIEPV